MNPLLTRNLEEAITCIAEHPGGRLATTYHISGWCSWAYRWGEGLESWTCDDGEPHPSIAHKFRGPTFGLPDCHGRWEDRANLAWQSESFGQMDYELKGRNE